MRYLALSEVLELHRRVIAQSGGTLGVRSLGAVESAVAQPRMTFDGKELYPTSNVGEHMRKIGQARDIRSNLVLICDPNHILSAENHRCRSFSLCVLPGGNYDHGGGTIPQSFQMEFLMRKTSAPHLV